MERLSVEEIKYLKQKMQSNMNAVSSLFGGM